MESAEKIIVVDDEARICQAVEKILKKNDFEVITANSADEALEKMAEESFSLLISDIVMPGKNGLELLKMVKTNWPFTKAVMMTAYASTDTAMKAIRLGALDYLPKPFSPDELRGTVTKALAGELMEAPTSEADRNAINPMAVDMPFDIDEVSEAVGEEYADMLGRSDMPVVEVKSSEPLENFCELGDMVCDIFKKLGATCKAGIKKEICPQKMKKSKKGKQAKGFDGKTLIGVDEPFNYDEVTAVTGPEYVQHSHNGVSYVPYNELKANVEQMMHTEQIDVDIPFNREEVGKVTGDAYTEQLTRSDVPVVEVTASEELENFCELGDMVCDIFKKLGATCKAGIKTAACPQKKAKKGKKAKATGFDGKNLIAPELPFDTKEVMAAAGDDYINHLVHDSTLVTPYIKLKENYNQLLTQEAAQAALESTSTVEPDQKNILVIDDEVAVNNNIRKILAKKGYHVDQAVTKQEALDRISTQPYKLVLLDLKIPGVKGLELLEAVRAQNPNAKVIIITGYASIATAVEAARLGAVDYLPKPFTPDEIRNVTGEALKLAA